MASSLSLALLRIESEQNRLRLVRPLRPIVLRSGLYLVATFAWFPLLDAFWARFPPANFPIWFGTAVMSLPVASMALWVPAFAKPNTSVHTLERINGLIRFDDGEPLERDQLEIRTSSSWLSGHSFLLLQRTAEGFVPLLVETFRRRAALDELMKAVESFLGPSALQ
jgi:hypothetical protein